MTSKCPWQGGPPPRPDVGLWYLASPYSHKDRKVMDARIDAVHEAAIWCFHRRIPVFSPILYTTFFEKVFSAGDTEFWLGFDRPFMVACGGIIILTLPGWLQSNGIKAEVALFREMNKPRIFLDAEAILPQPIFRAAAQC